MGSLNISVDFFDYIIFKCTDCNHVLLPIFFGVDSGILGMRVKFYCDKCGNESDHKMKTIPMLGPIESDRNDYKTKFQYKLMHKGRIYKHLRKYHHPQFESKSDGDLKC